MYDYIRNHTSARERARKYRTSLTVGFSDLLRRLENGRGVVGDAYGDS